MQKVAVIMAGGHGERFWPLGRKKLPKQFIPVMSGGSSLFQATVERMTNIVDIEDIYIVTNADYCGIVKQQAPLLKSENILCEPCGRNTAPALAFAAAVLNERYGDAVMLVVPSDHSIGNVPDFISVMKKAASFSEGGNRLVTLGISPTYPETGYGYIKYTGAASSEHADVYKVSAFVEKPDINTAKDYLANGHYLWNSGMFVWKVSVFLEDLNKHCPDIYDFSKQISAAVNSPDFEKQVQKAFLSVSPISIDYALMEKSEHVYTFPASFAWSDVGSWNSISAVNNADDDGNVVFGKAVLTDCVNMLVSSSGRLVAAVGLNNVIIVETEDAVLVCSKDHAQDVKQVISSIKELGWEEYL